MFEIAMVNEPSEFEPLKFYCIPLTCLNYYFPFGTNGKLIVLVVPMLKQIRMGRKRHPKAQTISLCLLDIKFITTGMLMSLFLNLHTLLPNMPSECAVPFPFGNKKIKCLHIAC